MTHSRSSKFRRFRRGLLFALASSATILLLVLLLLPRLLEKEINRALHEHGWQDASAEVRFISLSRADLAGMDLGEGALHIDSIRVNYTLWGLLHKRVDAVELAGVQMRVPALFTLLSPGSSSAGTEPPIPPAHLPFRTIRFSDARILVEHGSQQEEFVLDGILSSSTNQQLTVQVGIHNAWIDLEAYAAADLARRAWQLRVDKPQLNGVKILNRLGFALPPTMQLAPLEASLTLSQDGPAQTVGLVADLRQSFVTREITNALRIAASGNITRDKMSIEGIVSPDQKAFALASWRGAGERLELPFSATVLPGESTNIQARIVVDAFHLSNPDKGLQIGSIRARVDLPVNPDQTATGTVDVVGIQHEDRVFGGIHAETRISFTEASALLRTDLLTDTEIALRAVYGETGLVASLVLPSLVLEDKEPLQKFLKEVAGVELSGRASAHGVWDLQANPSTLFNLSLSKVGIRQKDFSIEGLSGAIEFDDLAQFHSQPHQQVKIDKLSAGKFELTDGLLTFALEGKDHLFVEENHWTWAGGQLYSAAFHFKPSAHRLRMHAVCEGVQLQQVLNLAIGEQVTGTGDLYGRIPLSVGWDPYRFSIGKGYLFAAPGRGQIQVQDQQMIDQVISGATQSLAGTKQGREIQQGVLHSLKDFEYQALRLQFRQTDNGIPAGTMHIDGTGRDPQLGLPLNLTINFSGTGNE